MKREMQIEDRCMKSHFVISACCTLTLAYLLANLGRSDLKPVIKKRFQQSGELNYEVMSITDMDDSFDSDDD